MHSSARSLPFILIALILTQSCRTPSEKKGKDLPADSRVVHIDLADSLGGITLSLPGRYDTGFSWINESDCGRPCQRQEYRYQPRRLRISQETGWIYLGEPKDSVDQFTISYSRDVHRLSRRYDSSLQSDIHRHELARLRSDPSQPPILFDTTEMINDRIFSLIIMDRKDTIYNKRVLGIMTIGGNIINLEFALLRKPNDSLNQQFIDYAIRCLHTVRVTPP